MSKYDVSRSNTSRRVFINNRSLSYYNIPGICYDIASARKLLKCLCNWHAVVTVSVDILAQGLVLVPVMNSLGGL